jgi:predicted transcriptional regulator
VERATKSVSVSFRVSPLFKRCLEEAAAREQRSRTNMLEKLVLDYCRAHRLAGLEDLEEAASKGASREKTNDRRGDS